MRGGAGMGHAAVPMRALVVAAVSALVVSGCATPEARTRAALMDAGLSRPVSSCMAGRMVDRLSLAQLQRLGRLGKLDHVDDFDEFVRRTRALRDPEILAVVTTSGLVCAVRN